MAGTAPFQQAPPDGAQQLALCLGYLPCVFWIVNRRISAWPLPRKTLRILGWGSWNKRRPRAPALLCSSPSGLLPAAGLGAALAKESARETGEQAEPQHLWPAGKGWQKGLELEVSVLSLPESPISRGKGREHQRCLAGGGRDPSGGTVGGCLSWKLLARAGETNPALGAALLSEGAEGLQAEQEGGHCRGTEGSWVCLS